MKTTKLFFGFLLFLLTFTFGAFSASAQSADKYEKYVGYQLVASDTATDNAIGVNRDDVTASHGVNASITQYVNKNVGFTVEGAANFGSERQLGTVLGGVTVKANRDGKVAPFVRAMAGFVADRQYGEAAFGGAAAFGAGLDFGSGSKKLRVSGDYLLTTNTNLRGVRGDNVRVGVGLVF